MATGRGHPELKRRTGRRWRFRMVAAWVLFVLGVAGAGAWMASRWWPFEHRGDGWLVRWESGKLMLVADGITSETVNSGLRFSEESAPLPMFWTVDAESEFFARFGANLKLLGYGHIPGRSEWMTIVAAAPWPVPLMLWGAGGALVWPLVRRRLRRRRGECEACGFDRVGLAFGVACPECGTATGTLDAAAAK